MGRTELLAFLGLISFITGVVFLVCSFTEHGTEGRADAAYGLVQLLYADLAFRLAKGRSNGA